MSSFSIFNRKSNLSGASGGLLDELFHKSDISLENDFFHWDTGKEYVFKSPLNFGREISNYKNNFIINIQQQEKFTIKSFKKEKIIIGNYENAIDDDFYNLIEEVLHQNESKLSENPLLTTKNLSLKEIDEDNKYQSGCICGKSKCSNAFCSCRKGGKICGGLCRCSQCKNKSIKDLYRWKIIYSLKQNKIKCNCKRTNCHSAYCECFKAGKICQENCGCINCKNIENAKNLENNNNKFL